MHTSERDALTGIYNRRVEDRVLHQAVDGAVRGGEALCVAMLDLDGFKNINDTCGHDVGDAVLIAIVEILHANCRDSDTLVRHGGDEFLLVMPGSGAGEA